MAKPNLARSIIIPREQELPRSFLFPWLNHRQAETTQLLFLEAVFGTSLLPPLTTLTDRTPIPAWLDFSFTLQLLPTRSLVLAWYLPTFHHRRTLALADRVNLLGLIRLLKLPVHHPTLNLQAVLLHLPLQ